MRILMLAQFYPPIIGGTERYVRNLSVELVARGHEVAVITLWHQGLPRYEVDQGVRVHRVAGTAQRFSRLYSESSRRHAPPIPDPETVLALNRLVQLEQPDIVHAHNWFLYSYLPLKFRSPPRLVMTLHDCSLSCAQMRYMYQGSVCSGPGPLKCVSCSRKHYGNAKGVATALGNKAMGALSRRLVDWFLPVSNAVAECNKLGQGTTPYTVIPNFIPDRLLERSILDHPLLSSLPREPFLLFVGDLSIDKGVKVLLEAYAHLRQAPALVLIGRRLADTPTIPAAPVYAFYDWPHEAVLAAWQRSCCALAPSLCPDACPTVVLEAMAAGRTVVGSRIGGIPDLIADGVTGLLVTPGSAASLAGAVSRLIADPALRAVMGQAASERARSFSSSPVIARIEQVYRRLQAGRPLPAESLETIEGA